ncbi:putative non-specific serine/threonine protein kinase [Helianthus annuus]|uniref:Non-specific serine/threonine protein kinase n=2 Tax=Helianthus annuus TaxID=4232 RepID=A0A9K3IUL3_HELAN|nr:putative non-specific serine/threonine protein kinase [Helianthus annuus]KAJ0912697.1 putative non-specific serine/threonine protein kinase [Helianthus annuus]
MSLIHFIANNNQLSGLIPASIGSVQTLEVIRLDSNWLTGDVPQKLTELKSVNELHLSNNNLNWTYSRSLRNELTLLRGHEQ